MQLIAFYDDDDESKLTSTISIEVLLGCIYSICLVGPVLFAHNFL